MCLQCGPNDQLSGSSSVYVYRPLLIDWYHGVIETAMVWHSIVLHCIGWKKTQ